MGQLIELSYRRFPRRIIDTLVRSGYLLPAERHKLAAAMRAWDCLRVCPGTSKGITEFSEHEAD